MKSRAEIIELLLAVLLPLLYLLHLNADSISGLVGIYWMDESLYLLSAKNQALFGNAHPYPRDNWLPELRVPLLHILGLLTITKTHLILYTRIAVDVCVLGGAALLGYIAAHFHQSRRMGIICFISILLNPILFFYARLAMAEGMQFLIMACIIACLYELHTAKSFKSGLSWIALGGTLTGILFFSKISSVAACAALGIGAMLTIAGTTLPRKCILASTYACAAIAAIALYFAAIGASAWPDWWHVNMAGSQAIGQTPAGIGAIINALLYKMPVISYLCMMPIFAVYLPSLTVAANSQKKFLLILALTTMAMLLLDSLFGAAIRRNFFSLSMLSILFGFSCVDYVQNGMQRKPATAAKILGMLVIALHIFGAVLLVYAAIIYHNHLFQILSALFLALLILAITARGPALAPARKSLVASLACCSLLLMLFQVFFAPYTRQEVDAAIEPMIAPNSLITGPRSPVYFQGHGRAVLTNCLNAVFPVDFVNDIAPVTAQGKIYYIAGAPIAQDTCAPTDTDHYKLRGYYEIFNPENVGMSYGIDVQLTFRQPFYLYEKTGQD